MSQLSYMNINSDQYQTAYSIFNYNNINKSFAFVRVFNGITPIKYKVDATFIIPKNDLVFCCELDNDKEINPISTTKYILLEDFLIPKRFNERLKFLKIIVIDIDVIVIMDFYLKNIMMIGM